MHTVKMYRILALAAAMLLLCMGGALAKEPLSKTLENTTVVESDTLKVQIDQWCWNFSKKEDLRFFVANVHTTNPQQLMTAFAGEAYSANAVEAPSDIAARHNAVVAINGDYYNYKENVGLVIRNGVVYRDKNSTRDHLLVDNQGNFRAIMRADYEAGKGEALVSGGVMQCFTFGPMLMLDGAVLELPEKYNISTNRDQREPRTAIGQAGENHYVIVIADGRRKGWSDKGMTLPELQQVFAQEGCAIAYNLDGGGSTSLIVNGERVNQGSTSRERDVSDIIYFTN